MPGLFLLDAAAILNNPKFSFAQGKEYFISPEVLLEIQGAEVQKLVSKGLQAKQLKIIEAKQEFLQQAEKLLQRLGLEVSKPDKTVIALALEFKSHAKKFTVVTDDYSVQNLLHQQKIIFQTVMMEGIKKVMSFKRKCPSCGKQLVRGEELCTDCYTPEQIKNLGKRN